MKRKEKIVSTKVRRKGIRVWTPVNTRTAKEPSLKAALFPRTRPTMEKKKKPHRENCAMLPNAVLCAWVWWDVITSR